MQLESVDKIINDNIFLKFKGFTCDIDVFVKVEGMNAGGSIKMKTAKALINDAIEEKGLLKSKRFIESSSGNLGLSLSIIAAAKGLHFTCVVDKNTSTQNVKMMRALGTEVIIIEHKDAQGGYLGNRLAYIHSAIEKDPALIWLNQYQNMANPAVHAEMTAKSILAEFGKVDYLFIGAGTTGTLMGCARFFRRYSPETTLIAVDSIGSITFGTPGSIRHLPGLGSSVQPHFFDESQIDLLIQIPEAETVATCRDIARRFGYLGGASTGTVLAAVKRLHMDIARDANVVAISPDMGSGYVDTVYNDEWCYRTFGDSWEIQEKNNNMEGIGYV
ncbi:2,3-diaminopropionate biosynthesis protein SbnA [Pantoea agglomerans]|uniref:cysteine synthase n=1 Tax=Enterobacter agglomerans TaxID=549 RepID=E2JA26_ENTAG|nr:2,3-diaminopropionate biosynthesis protein SbnA [Pantoea agglomerans]ADN39480.1 DdaA [Pantoea agglomerans]KYN62871.1 2,3-diaminopropionate biosynthesis protein SbnA [Pantoea agglomerans]